MRWKRPAAAILLVALAAALCETAARRFIRERFHGQDPLRFYYPQLAYADSIGRSRDTLNVCLLGSSVTASPQLPRCLEAKLGLLLHRPVNVYNLSYIGSTIRDAYYLYKWIGARRFDAVIVQQGVGDLRLNHYVRAVDPGYANVSWFRRRRDADLFWHPAFQAPMALAYAWTSRKESRGELFKDWNLVAYPGLSADSGSTNVAIAEYKTAYAELIGIAKRRGEKVLCASLAFNVDGPWQRRLVQEYNDTTRAVARENGEAFLDLSELNGRKALYQDPFHFLRAGQEAFCDCLARAFAASR